MIDLAFVAVKISFLSLTIHKEWLNEPVLKEKDNEKFINTLNSGMHSVLKKQSKVNK